MSEDMILRVLTGNDKWQKISVPASGAILGSDSDCDIILDEPTVSPKHCHIVCDKGDWGIDAIGGCTGVSVNGQKTNGSPLKEGDRIELGAMFLEVVRLPVPQFVPAASQGATESSATNPPAARIKTKTPVPAVAFVAVIAIIIGDIIVSRSFPIMAGILNKVLFGIGLVSACIWLIGYMRAGKQRAWFRYMLGLGALLLILCFVAYDLLELYANSWSLLPQPSIEVRTSDLGYVWIRNSSTEYLYDVAIKVVGADGKEPRVAAIGEVLPPGEERQVYLHGTFSEGDAIFVYSKNHSPWRSATLRGTRISSDSHDF